MRILARRSLPFGLVLAGSVYVAFHGRQTGDYRLIFAPAMNALLSGHVGTFFARLPLDGAGGSLLLRAPAALIGKHLAGGYFGPYRFAAAGCILAGGLLGLWLAREMRAAGASLLSRIGTVALFVIAPAALQCVFYGHPEEALGAALCVIAVLAAARRRPLAAGLILGVAIIDKPWAALAIVPVVLAAPDRRLRVLVSAAVIAGGFNAVAFLASPQHFTEVLKSTGATVLAHPPELWWPLAHWETRDVVNPLWRTLHGFAGPTAGFFPPTILAKYAHELPLLAAGGFAALLWRRRGGHSAGRDDGPAQPLALLALVFALRCLLDPANYVYYEVPFLFALAAWQAQAGHGPLLALTALAALWFIFERLPDLAAMNVQYAAYLIVTLPLVALLTVHVLGLEAVARRLALRRAAPAL